MIGLGKIGLLAEVNSGLTKPTTHVGAFLKHPRLQLVGCVEANPKSRNQATQRLPGVPIYQNTIDLFHEIIPDIVSIATPDETHYAITQEAIKAGVKLIICEKPIAENTVDAEKMIRFAKRQKVILLVNHSRRFDSVFQSMAEKIKSNIGDIQAVRVTYVNGLRNNGSHVVDLLRWWLGDPIWVCAWLKEEVSASHRGDLNVDAVLEFPSGIRAVLQALEKNNYYSFTQEIYGTQGVYFIKALGHDIRLSRVMSGIHSSWPELELDPKKIPASRKTFFESMAEHAVQCLDGKEQPRATGEDGLATVRIIEALLNSARRGGKKIILK